MNKINIVEYDPIIQITIKYLSNPDLSLQNIAKERGITRQAIWKKVVQGCDYLKAFKIQNSIFQENKIKKLEKENSELKKASKKQDELILHLKRQLILKAIENKLLQWFKFRVLEFLPKFKLGRLKAYQKKHMLDLLIKFKNNKGNIKDFSKATGHSQETILRWKKAYNTSGLNGLVNKNFRPKNFGNKITTFVKKQLIALFLRYPFWDDYQYHKYIRFNPTTNYYVSLPTIRKLKNAHKKRSEEEIARIKKRWAFAPGTDVWTIDFTCILKTEKYKLQLLTVTDSRSRFLFESALFLETSTELVIAHLEELFMKHGRPNIIKADNGPEFRTDCRENLKTLSVYLLNSPTYYAKFNGAHERIHRTLKQYISDFNNHMNITRLVEEINLFLDEYNYQIPHEYLEGKTPSEVYFNDKTFIPKNSEIIKPYEKDGELRLKFTNRKGKQARISMPLLDT